MDTRKFLDNAFVKANINVKQGDLLRFKDQGKEVPDRTDPNRLNLEVTVEIIRDGAVANEKTLSVNATNLKSIAAIYGYNSLKWIGKEMMVNVVKRQNPQGVLVDAVALSAPVADHEEEETEIPDLG